MDNTLDMSARLQAMCLRRNGYIPPPPPSPKPPVPEPVVSPVQEPVLYQPAPGIDCWHCDFRQLPLEDGTVDYVCTDIPWRTGWLRHVEDFAEWCSRKLKPDGVVTTLYTGYNLDRLLATLTKHLRYVWMCVSPMHGCVPRPYTAWITRCTTLCVVLGNTKKPFLHRSAQDLLPYSWREKKKWHEHQQSLNVVQYLV